MSVKENESNTFSAPSKPKKPSIVETKLFIQSRGMVSIFKNPSINPPIPAIILSNREPS